MVTMPIFLYFFTKAYVFEGKETLENRAPTETGMGKNNEKSSWSFNTCLPFFDSILLMTLHLGCLYIDISIMSATSVMENRKTVMNKCFAKSFTTLFVC